MNCLEHSLLMWLNNPEFRLWYNSNHVVIIEPDIELSDKGYLELDEFGVDYFVKSFNLDSSFIDILIDYFDKMCK